MTKEFIDRGFSVGSVNTGPTGLSRDLRYHSHRIRTHTRAALQLWGARREPGRLLYIGGAAGAGQYYQLVLLWIAVRLGYRVAFHHHGYSYIDRPSLSARLLCRARGTVFHVTLCSKMTADLQRLYNPDLKAFEQSNAFLIGDVGPSATRRPLTRGELTIGIISNLSIEKGVAEVIATSRALVGIGVAHRLYLAGPIVDQSTERLVSDSVKAYPEELEWIGHVETDRVPKFLASLDFFLFPSQSEADPLVVREAIAAGCRVIAYDRGCVSSAMVDGLLIRPDEDFVHRAAEYVRDLVLGVRLDVDSRLPESNSEPDGRNDSGALNSLFDYLTGQSVST